MADRTTKVTLIAEVSNYIAGMSKAAAATKKTGTEAQKLSAQKQAFADVGHTALVAGGVIAAGIAVAIRDAMFSEYMTLTLTLE